MRRYYKMPQNAQAWLFRRLAHQHNFWSRSAFLKKHRIPSRCLKESISGNSVKISNCRAFSPFKTLPGCRAYSHSVYENWTANSNKEMKLSDPLEWPGTIVTYCFDAGVDTLQVNTLQACSKCGCCTEHTNTKSIQWTNVRRTQV